MPSHADEEAHQLSYLQKHMANMISLLAEPSEGEGEESQVCSNLYDSFFFFGVDLSVFMTYRFLFPCFMNNGFSLLIFTESGRNIFCFDLCYFSLELNY